MNISSVVAVLFVTALGIAACGNTTEVNAERTAACSDRTNGVSCDACCNTAGAAYTTVCTCKGKLDAPK